MQDKYHDHLKQLEEELDFYRQKTCNKKDEEKASESNNTDETKPEKDNVKKDEKNDEGDEGKAEKVGKSEKMSDLESVINSLKLQLSGSFVWLIRAIIQWLWCWRKVEKVCFKAL